VRRDALRLAAALGIATAARMVHQNSPDDLRADGEKVYAVFAANAARSNQLEASLIGDSGRFQRVAGVPAGQLSPGDSPQVRVNSGHQAAKRLFITTAPGGDQSADVPWTL